MWRRVDLVRTDVSEECVASIFRLEEPHGATSQKTAFFIATDVKTSNPTFLLSVLRKNINISDLLK
jgi:hypothetical protein